MRIWSISDIGLVRHENQDACGTMLIEDYTAAVVCDGMGGTAGGSVASKLAVETYRQALEGNLRRSILQLSMTPDLCDEHFAGNASGIALQYKLWGIEQVRSAKERTFTDGVKKLLTALSAGAGLLGQTVDLTAGELTLYKNLPQDNATLADTLLSLSPLLSRQTILENLPWVADVTEELRRKAAENN